MKYVVPTHHSPLTWIQTLCLCCYYNCHRWVDPLVLHSKMDRLCEGLKRVSLMKSTQKTKTYKKIRTFDDRWPKKICNFATKSRYIQVLSCSLNQKFCIDLLQHFDQITIIIDGIENIGRWNPSKFSFKKNVWYVYRCCMQTDPNYKAPRCDFGQCMTMDLRLFHLT